jgi:acetyltransferase-like isoleucine patch superfamily enzyme
LITKMNESTRSAISAKALLTSALSPLAWFQRVVVGRWLRLWNIARLQEALGRKVDSSNVIMGGVELHGTRNVHIGRGVLIYPGVYLETQGDGVITIGHDVVLSRGVHIVAFQRVTLGDGCMVGEYASLRDANHKLDDISIRNAGHISAAIEIGRNVWIGRGAAILKGASIGDNSVVGANSVLTKPLAACQVVGGVPARALRQTASPPSLAAPAIPHS